MAGKPIITDRVEIAHLQQMLKEATKAAEMVGQPGRIVLVLNDAEALAISQTLVKASNSYLNANGALIPTVRYINVEFT